MKRITVTFLLICLLASMGCGRLRNRRSEGEYSGFPHASRDKDHYKNTSLCKTTDDVLYSRPCAMTTMVSEDFYKGYQDGVNNKKVRIFGKNEDYQSGHELGENDRKNGAIRKFEIKR
jgi:hypothetical protein